MSDEVRPLTEKQLDILERFGYDTNTISDANGKDVIDRLAANKWKPLADGPKQDVESLPKTPLDSNGPATKKQKATLVKFGYDANVTFAQASAVMDELAANGWKKPEALEV